MPHQEIFCLMDFLGDFSWPNVMVELTWFKLHGSRLAWFKRNKQFIYRAIYFIFWFTWFEFLLSNIAVTLTSCALSLEFISSATSCSVQTSFFFINVKVQLHKWSKFLASACYPMDARESCTFQVTPFVPWDYMETPGIWNNFDPLCNSTISRILILMPCLHFICATSSLTRQIVLQIW